MNQGRKYAIVARDQNELRDAILRTGAGSECVMTCGTYDTETGFLSRTHLDELSDKYIKSLLKIQIAHKWPANGLGLRSLLASIFSRGI